MLRNSMPIAKSAIDFCTTLDDVFQFDPPSERDLYNMGWRRTMEAEVYEFDDYYVGY